MNRRTLLRRLFVAPIAAAAVPFLPKLSGLSWSLSWFAKPDGTIEPVSLAPVFSREWVTGLPPSVLPPMHPNCRCVMLPATTWHIDKERNVVVNGGSDELPWRYTCEMPVMPRRYHNKRADEIVADIVEEFLDG